MQARRSSLYRKKPPVIFFEDDFTTHGTNRLDGRTPSGGTGHWQDTTYTTKGIKCTSTHYAIPADATNTVCSINAIPGGSFDNQTRIRIKSKQFTVNGDGTGFFAGTYLWNTTSASTGVRFAQLKTASADGVDASISVYDTAGEIKVYKSAATSGTQRDWELHVEKLSSTSIKVGGKIDGSWVQPPEVHTVTSGFFTAINKPVLVLRNGGGTTALGARCYSILIDDQVDW